METDTNYHVHTLRTESFADREAIRDTTTYYIDGAETPFSRVGGGAGTGGGTQFDGEATTIGSFPAVDSLDHTVHHGEIAEVRVYDRALPGADRSTVESRLADRYGIELD